MRKLFKRFSGLAGRAQSDPLDESASEEISAIQALAEAEAGGQDDNGNEAADDDGADEDTDAEDAADDDGEAENGENGWIPAEDDEGQLSIDVYQTNEAIVVKSTIAGVKPEDIDISINNDMLTIRGKRMEQNEIPEESYLYKECYWGSFSRSIILPVEIVNERIEAILENGVLTVILPKAKVAKPISIRVRER